ncbi:hypothetical protein Tco_0512983, partial [Tanacetum coccineum]
QRLGSGRLDVPINVVRKSTDVLVNLLDFVATNLVHIMTILVRHLFLKYFPSHMAHWRFQRPA